MYYLDDLNLSSTTSLVQDINDLEVINVYPQPAIDNLNIDIKLNNFFGLVKIGSISDK